MSFEPYAATANSHLSVWAKGIHEQATNVPENTLRKVKGALGVISLLSLAKVPYDLYNGNFSYISNVGPIIVMSIMKAGIDYVQAVKTSEFNELKNKIQNTVINRAEEPQPILNKLPIPLGFRFGTSNAEKPAGFSFGIPSADKSQAEFSFGTPSVDKSQAGFRFGTSNTEKSTGFSFGA